MSEHFEYQNISICIYRAVIIWLPCGIRTCSLWGLCVCLWICKCSVHTDTLPVSVYTTSVGRVLTAAPSAKSARLALGKRNILTIIIELRQRIHHIGLLFGDDRRATRLLRQSSGRGSFTGLRSRTDLLSRRLTQLWPVCGGSFVLWFDAYRNMNAYNALQF